MYTEPSFDDISEQLELRVLQGPQSGSRLSISSGEYILGKSDACAIILNGPRIEDEHAQITIEDQEVQISGLEGSVSDAQGNEIQQQAPGAKPNSPAVTGGQARQQTGQ